MKRLGLLVETLLDEWSSNFDHVLKKAKSFRRETRDHLCKAMHSKTLVSMSTFNATVGADQNCASVADAESGSQSAIGIVESIAR